MGCQIIILEANNKERFFVTGNQQLYFSNSSSPAVVVQQEKQQLFEVLHKMNEASKKGGLILVLKTCQPPSLQLSIAE